MSIENFTTYSETDPNSHITIDSATKVSYAGLTLGEQAWVNIDKTANHFAGDFEHLCKVRIISSVVDEGNPYVYVWGVSNANNDLYTIQGASGSFLAVRATNAAGVYSLGVIECDSGSPNGGASITITADTDYYLKIKRDEAVGDYGTLYCYVYSDASRETLVGTSSYALNTSKKDFRYVYAVSSRNGGETSTITGNIESLDLQEGVVYTIDLDVGAFTLTGINILLHKALQLIGSVGSFTLTGIDVLIQKGYGIITSVGQFILTGKNIAIKLPWQYTTKHTSTYTNQSKNTSTWTDKTKNSSSWTFTPKN